MFHQSHRANRILQPLLTLVYLLVCWFVSVDVVFNVGGMNSLTVSVWAITAFVDIFLSLNTVSLSKGKSLKTRSAIIVEYLRRECYLDVVMVVYMVVDYLELDWEVSLTVHLLTLVALVVKLSQKGELLRTYFSFKRYLGLADSVLLLLIFSHINVQTTST